MFPLKRHRYGYPWNVPARLLWVGASLCAVLAVMWLTLPHALPAEDSRSLRLFDRNGSLLRDIPATDGRRGVALPAIPPLLAGAVLLSEDRRFYTHGGVDYPALARAAWRRGAGDSRSGASTVSMQVARMAGDIPRTLPGKFLQIAAAARLDGAVSKDEILAWYLNHVPYGGTVTGAGEACRAYFGTDCSLLSAAQAATLAVLVRAPNRLLAESDELARHRDRLLARMAEAGLIDAAEARHAVSEPVPTALTAPGLLAPHFTERVRRAMPEGASGPVRTSLDLALQNDVQALVAQAVHSLESRDVNAAAALVVDNATGEILAYVGSPDFFDTDNAGMVDYAAAPRQPGSTIKPFTYALALTHGGTLADLVPDLPVVVSTRAGPYRPRNYGGDFTGPRRIREALGNSLNVPAVVTALELDPANLLALLRASGIDSLTRESEDYGPGLTLGNGEVPLDQMVRAYAMLARGGRTVPLTHFRHDGPPPEGERVLPERVAWLIGDVLRDPLAREGEFGRHNDLSFPFPVAAKTGTSSSYRDNWVLGYTPRVTVGVWVGQDAGRPMHGVSGITGAGPLFHQVMRRAMQGRGTPWPEVPDGLVARDVCPLSGHLPGPDCDGTVREWFRAENAPTATCTVHRHVRAEICRDGPRTVRYMEPEPRFRQWSQDNGLPLLARAMADACGPEAPLPVVAVVERGGEATILEPRDRSIYAVDPNIPPHAQRMPLRLLLPEGAGQVDWLIDGEPVALEAADTVTWLWPLSRGRHTFRARYRDARGTERQTDAAAIRVL